MDYEKKYKEGVEWLRDWIYLATTGEMREQMEKHFPELKESEGEQSKKWILEYLYEGLRKSDEQFKSQFKAAIAWFEKHNLIMAKSPQLGEQKPTDKVEPKFKVKYAGSEYNVFETKDIAGVTFYGIEDEPNHIDYVKADNCEIISGYGIKESGLSFPTKPVMFSEQETAWSEEDKAVLDALIRRLEGEDLYVSPHLAVKCLKSLKDRVQPKQEWSEKDEGFWDLLLAIFTNEHPNGVFTTNNIPIFDGNWVTSTKIIAWLKSIKERYSWKPSDEQIGVIEAVINNRSFQKRHLDSLYEQLKKLKGE